MRALTLVLLLAGLSAHATARRFSMVNDASTNSEGEIELEGWMDLGRPANQRTNVMFWLGTRFGLLDNLELASFLVFEKRDNEMTAPTAIDTSSGNGLMEWVTELRFRPVEVGKWPVDLFFQIQLIDWFEQFHPFQFRITVGLSKQVSRFLFAANFSYWVSTVVEPKAAGADPIFWQWLEPSVAASVKLIESDGSVPAVNLGAELWAFVALSRSNVHSHLLMDGGLVVGPTLSASRGRLWISANLGIPVVTNLPGLPYMKAPGLKVLVGRVMLGIAL